MKKRKTKALDALAAARKCLETNSGVKETAAEFGISEAMVTMSLVILEYGTKQEIEAALATDIGVVPLANKIRASFSPEVRKARQGRNGVWSHDRKDKLKQQAELWAQLGPSLKSLATLPHINDMVEVVSGNTGREHTVNETLETALNWLKEFANAWATRKQKKHYNNGANPRTSNSDAGVQHPEPASE